MGSTPEDSIASQMLVYLPSIRLSDSVSTVSSPRISLREISTWSMPNLSCSTTSNVCEYGRCPTSCRRAAHSTSMDSLGSSLSAAQMRPATAYVPSECSNRVWFAPGYTRYARPSWCTLWRRCSSGASTSDRNTPSTLTLPWTESWIVLWPVNDGSRTYLHIMVQSDECAGERTIPCPERCASDILDFDNNDQNLLKRGCDDYCADTTGRAPDGVSDEQP